MLQLLTVCPKTLEHTCFTCILSCSSETEIKHLHLCFLTFAAIQTALRLQREGNSSLHQELKLKRRVQREHSNRERSRSTRSSCSSRSSQSDDSNFQEMERMEKEKEKQDLEIESIIQVRWSRRRSFVTITLWGFCCASPSAFCSMRESWRSAEGSRRRGREGSRGRCRWIWRDS